MAWIASSRVRSASIRGGGGHPPRRGVERVAAKFRETVVRCSGRILQLGEAERSGGTADPARLLRLVLEIGDQSDGDRGRHRGGALGIGIIRVQDQRTRHAAGLGVHGA